MFKLDDLPAADADALGDDLVNELPEPQQHAIDQAQVDAGAENPAGDTSMELDALGIPWNPEEHATGKDGKGIRTAKGTWRKRRGVSGSAPRLNANAGRSGAAESEKPADPEAQQRAAAEQQCRVSGIVAAQLFTRSCMIVGGPEFTPRIIKITDTVSIDEQKYLGDAFGDYFVAKGVVDIPPGVVLGSALLFYMAPRFTAPPVRERFGGIGKSIKKGCTWLWWKWKYRNTGGKPPEVAKSEREEQVSESRHSFS